VGDVSKSVLQPPPRRITNALTARLISVPWPNTRGPPVAYGRDSAFGILDQSLDVPERGQRVVFGVDDERRDRHRFECVRPVAVDHRGVGHPLVVADARLARHDGDQRVQQCVDATTR
jgi:hypothetical protein